MQLNAAPGAYRWNPVQEIKILEQTGHQRLGQRHNGNPAQFLSRMRSTLGLEISILG
jgi:hypothetical protein